MRQLAVYLRHAHARMYFILDGVLYVSAPTLLSSKEKKIKLLRYPFQIPSEGY